MVFYATAAIILFRSTNVVISCSSTQNLYTSTNEFQEQEMETLKNVCLANITKITFSIFCCLVKNWTLLLDHNKPFLKYFIIF